MGNSKKYNDMCNYYESIISQLEYELSMLQQAYNDMVVEHMELVEKINGGEK